MEKPIRLSVLATGLFLLGLHSAKAVTIALEVTTLSDDFAIPIAGSLRAAINSANADPTNDYVINFNVPGGGTLALDDNPASLHGRPRRFSP